MPNAGDMTHLTFIDYYTRMEMLAQSVFEWKGLPKGINPAHIEKYLFNEGSCMFFKDPELGWMVTKCLQAGDLNYYDEPIELYPEATNYMKVQSYTNGENCVLICNNIKMLPTRRTTRLYAARIAEIQRTADIKSTIRYRKDAVAPLRF